MQAHLASPLPSPCSHSVTQRSEARRRFDEECARLRVDNQALQAQLAAMERSVGVMADTRAPKALAAQQQQVALAESAERKLKHQVGGRDEASSLWRRG